jgi:hypothetical protein
MERPVGPFEYEKILDQEMSSITASSASREEEQRKHKKKKKSVKGSDSSKRKSESADLPLLLSEPSDTASGTISPLFRRPVDKVSPLEQLFKSVPFCWLRPYRFFVSWHGVIILMFDGWPRPLKQMKVELEKCYSAHMSGVCAEQFGSQFPKMTLAALKDGHTLTREELLELRELCDKHPIAERAKLNVDRLDLVTYSNKSQEIVLSEKELMLCARHEYRGSPCPLTVDMSEDDDEPYLRHGHRISHYRRNDIGVSLVYRPPTIPEWITKFTDALPAMYEVFDERSFHVTVRAIR